MNVANSWAFWIGLIGALAVLYVLPTNDQKVSQSF